MFFYGVLNIVIGNIHECLYMCVNYKTGGSHQGIIVRQKGSCQGRSLGQSGNDRREYKGFQSCISPRDLGWSFSIGSFYLGMVPQT